MKIWAGIAVFAMIVCCQKANAYTHKKATLLVDMQAQADSDGYNFVSDLTTDVYNWISNGQIVLWDSPEKKKPLKLNDLQNVEIRSRTFFSDLSSVYIYENWSSHEKTSSFTVDGFSFIGSTYKGRDVIYGFVAFNDTLRKLFENTPMHINANGNYGTTLYMALMNMGFQFTLIYFNKNPLVNYKTSTSIATKAFGPKRHLLNRIISPKSKIVEYGWDSTSDEQVKLSYKIIKTLNDFFNDNRQEFFNVGGDKIYSFLKDAPIVISGFRVIEIWTKEKNGKIYYTPQSIVLSTKGVHLPPISFDELSNWNIPYNGGSLSNFLRAKDFPYTLKKINNTIIPNPLAESYKDALFAYPWNQILEPQ